MGELGPGRGSEEPESTDDAEPCDVPCALAERMEGLSSVLPAAGLAPTAQPRE